MLWDMRMKHMDLFSGIGGMTLALKGISTPILYCDKCPHSRRVLTNHMDSGDLPNALIVDDVSDVLRQAHALSADVITAGFPCTGFARCGAHKAFLNKDSALFHVLMQIVEVVQPTLVFMENTPAITADENIAVVKQAFHQLSYQLEHCLMPAYAVGLPHNRLRWFAIAFRDKQELQSLQEKVVDIPRPPLSPPRTTQALPTRPSVRFNLLKNALIPACARLALACLLTGQRTPSTKPDIKLEIEQGELRIQKRLWPTLFGHYRMGARVLTHRCSRDLITAVKHERMTPQGHVNFAFLEWMMGFPSDWTSALHISSALCL